MEALNVILIGKKFIVCLSLQQKVQNQWFQYIIIHRILGTNSLLYKINQKPNDKCSFCLEEVERIEHIFWSCNKISKLWEELPLNLTIILFGITDKSKKNLPYLGLYNVQDFAQIL